MSKEKLVSPTSIKQAIYESLSTVPEKGVLQGKRRLTKGLPGKRVVFFPSYKNSGLMPCESRLEADNCLDYEFDKSVISYRTQAFTVDLGNNESYTPDSIDIDHLGTLSAREVKFSGTLENDKLVERLDRIKKIFSMQGVHFQVITEKHLQDPITKKNKKFIYRFSHYNFIDAVLQLGIQQLNNLPKNSTLQSFREQCHKSNLPYLLADKLIYLGYVSFDENEELTASSNIWKNGGQS